MHEDAWSKAERYRQAANRYGDLAKQAEPGYLAEVFRKIAVRYMFMSEDVSRPERLTAAGMKPQDKVSRLRSPSRSRDIDL